MSPMPTPGKGKAPPVYNPGTLDSPLRVGAVGVEESLLK